MEQFLNLIDTVLTKGKKRTTSVQGPGTIVYPGYEMRFRMDDGFPLITTRSLKGSWKAVRAELLWLLSGSDDIADLHKDGVHLWDSWATPEICAQYGLQPGRLGRIYGPQWRSWSRRENDLVDKIADIIAWVEPLNGEKIRAIKKLLENRPRGGETIDQIANLVHEIKTFPDSKRMKVTAWNPEDVDKVFIAPCHGDFKFIVAEGGLYLILSQRSADLLVGVPFNIAGYALLLLMMAQVTGLKAVEFVHYLIDVHIYFNQVEYAKMQLERAPKPLPEVWLNLAVTDIFGFQLDDFVLKNYNPHPAIKGIPVAI